ncbi:MAG: Cytochrome c-type biogenesis protein CcmH [Candidatus Erwinia impunctatus]|nr:Cytochrome c-type biogenesis protein CcmH [Culicoides impunctatus]
MKKLTLILLFQFLSLVVRAENSMPYVFLSAAEEQEYHQILTTLRCPKCQNNSIADSNAMIASDMRLKVYQLMQTGQTPEQIRAYMVERYGNFVTYEPPLNSTTLILWIGPALFLLLGVGVIVLRGRQRTADKHNLSDSDQTRLASLLENERSKE